MDNVERTENPKPTQNSSLSDFIYRYSGAEFLLQTYTDLTREKGKPADEGRSGDDKLAIPPSNDTNTGKLPSIQKDLTDEKQPEQLPKNPEDVY